MEDVLKVIFLGVVQGVTEFLPISSSGHLVFLEWFLQLKKEDFGLNFDVALHLGTLFALIMFFGKDYWQILKSVISYLKTKKKFNRTNQQSQNKKIKLFWAILVATLPAATIGLFFNELIEEQLRFPWLVSLNLAFWGGMLFIGDLVSSKRETQNEKKIENISLMMALKIGIFQAFALVPGVSRSGATITAGLLLGFNRESSAKFSFLIAGPIILGASIISLPDLFSQKINLFLVLAGIFSAAFSGYLAIKGLLNFVKKRSLVFFVWYRLILAGIILGLWFLR